MDFKFGHSGEKYGKLTIIKEIEHTPSGMRRVFCKCDCGNTRITSPYSLHNGNVTCCEECLKKKKQDEQIQKYRYMIGETYGKLTVDNIFYDTNKKRVMAHSVCSCEDHNELICSVHYLLSGNTKSCGCIEKNRGTRKNNKYDLNNDYGIGYFDDGDNFYFDLEDLDKIKKYYWSKLYVNDLCYAVTKRKINGINKSLLMHRLVMGVLDNPNVEVDHIKHNTLDNRKSQLRIGTKWENNLNHGLFVNNTSGYSGVQWDKKNKRWYATITYNGEHYWLGYYDKKEDAINARKYAEDYYFKEWSYDNSMNAILPEEEIENRIE